MLEHENVSGVVESLKIVTEVNTERLCRFAFDHARLHGRKKVTLVHKAVIASFFFNLSRIFTKINLPFLFSWEVYLGSLRLIFKKPEKLNDFILSIRI
jgi:hypothetical protein